MKALRTAAAIAILFGFRSAPALPQAARLSGIPVAPHAGPDPRPPDWGTGATSYDNIGAAEFLPKDSISTYGTFVSPAGRYATSSGARFQATPHIPGGALLTYLELDYCDTDASDALTLSLYDCDYLGICSNQLGFISTPVSTPDCSNYMWVDLSPVNYTVSNNSRRLLLEITTGSGTIDKSFYGAIVGYKLQVSQPPPTPSFNDVPVTDFGYQYIEALYASGITGGCGGGNFCPDSPVTRRQMAIFIAKALGLSWSGY
jgi:hypothetical protein